MATTFTMSISHTPPNGWHVTWEGTPDGKDFMKAVCSLLCTIAIVTGKTPAQIARRAIRIINDPNSRITELPWRPEPPEPKPI